MARDPEKRRASYAKYDASPKGRARNARYAATPHGRAAHKRANERYNPRQITIGRRYLGVAETAEHATVINAHIKDRLRTFTAGQRAHNEDVCR